MKNFIKKTSLKNDLFWIVFIFSLVLSAYGGYLNVSPQQRRTLNKVQVDDSFISLKTLSAPIDATAYLVGDLSNGKILLARNQDFHLFPASLSKLMTAVIIMDNFSLNEPITITNYSVSAEGDEGNLKAGEIFSVKDLLKVLLIPSSNDAAVAFATSLNKAGVNFVDLMNEKSQKLGMNNTAFFGETGLDRKGNFTTVEDLFKLSQEIYFHYPLIGEITRQPKDEVTPLNSSSTKQLMNTDILTSQLPELWLSKTGSTPGAQDCLLTIFEFPFKDGKIPIGIVVLNSRDRFGDTLKLYHWTKDLLQSQ
ncbi:MAG: D-alanyl-D-alanine carboxypeptidase family protein [Minisyncoccia bacterium]